jgi:hypothetical protein
MATTSRFGNTPGKEDSYRLINVDKQSPAYAASLVVATKKARTIYFVALTGVLSLTIGVGAADTNPPFVDDEIEFQFTADAGGARVVTFSTGFQSQGTASVAASKFGTVGFRFNGTAWVEKYRALTA